MFLGIEIGGTKLQLGVGRATARSWRSSASTCDPSSGAAGILEQIEALGPRADRAASTSRPSASALAGRSIRPRGVVIKSHHVDGWDDFPLVDWCRRALALPATLENDCDAAGLAEARFGAGQGRRVVFYVTVGTGIGGGLVVDGKIYRGNGHGAAEIGHLRPGLHADRPDQTVESLASGWGIAAAARPG